MSITKDSPPRTLPRGESLKLIIATAIYLFIFRLAPAAFASSTVTVNEICPRCDPEWVELYNNSNNPISLENWQLKDSNSSSSDDITLIGSIQPNSFLVFDHDKGWLNDSGDSITLIDSNGNSIDSYSYPSATENKTFSRIPDGTGEFQNNTVSTKSSANQAIPTSTPTPSPTPTSTPNPTPTPKPTSTPKPTATTTPIPTNTSTPTSTPTSILAKTDNNSSPQILAGADENSGFEPEVNLDIIDLTATAESEINPSPTPKQEKTGGKNLPVAIISAAGVILMLGGGLPLIWSEFKSKKGIISK